MAARDSDVRVLIVEDDEDLAAILRATLERHGLKTFHAETGGRALELSDQVDPDLVVLDLTLPDIDGFAVVDWLRGHGRLGRLPLVVYTARDIDAEERGRLRLGDQTVFFTKGRITPEQVEERVMQLLGRIPQHGEELVLDGAEASTGG
ncbi:MAG: response regulator [Solirubrobacterales bacterium]|nr:response regulator [Solirubrobacterales bacterium]